MDHLVLETEEARPAAEDKSVVGGDDGDDIDALRLELVVLLKERREMVRVARGLHWLESVAVSDGFT